jgi:predicted ester cyclase
VNSDIHEANKRSIHSQLNALCDGGIDNLSSHAAELYADDATCNAFHPVNDLEGREEIAESLWKPLLHAFPDAERRAEVLIAGDYQGRNMVSIMGHIQGTFSNALFDIPPTHGVAYLRCCEIHVVEGGHISHSWVLYDMLDLMRQAGCWPIAQSLGAEGRWAGPATSDGVRPDTIGAETGAAALDVIKAMHRALFDFDGKNLDSMDLAKYWTRNFLWYGPSGIGTTRRLDGFRAHHQIPFLRAFPDRTGGGHVANIGDGDFVITGGWPSVVATHTGKDWLGIPPTGKRVGMRVMDFYRVETGRIAENWVPIDIINILLQLGVDVFERMRHRTGNPRMTL